MAFMALKICWHLTMGVSGMYPPTPCKIPTPVCTPPTPPPLHPTRSLTPFSAYRRRPVTFVFSWGQRHWQYLKFFRSYSTQEHTVFRGGKVYVSLKVYLALHWNCSVICQEKWHKGWGGGGGRVIINDKPLVVNTTVRNRVLQVPGSGPCFSNDATLCMCCDGAMPIEIT